MVAELQFLCTALPHDVFHQYTQFQVDSFNSLAVMTWTKIQRENQHGAITQKIRVLECTALLHNMFYQCMTFQARTKFGWIDGQTDVQTR